MNGVLLNTVLRTALQFYTRTRLQRWMLAATLLLFTAQFLAARRACPCPASFSVWPFLLGGLTIGAAATTLISAAWDFRRISALRTVFLIPQSRLKLAAGLFLAQLIAAAAVTAVVTGLVMLVGHAQPPPPLAWGTPRGTFEMLFGCALFSVVLLQVMTGPSRVLSVASLAPLTLLAIRGDLFIQPQILGMPKADVLALAGTLAWLLFAAWYVLAWRPSAPGAVWRRGGRPAAARVQGWVQAQVPASRNLAIQVSLLGQPSVLRVCRQQLAVWLGYHLFIVGMFSAMKLLVGQHTFPADYSMAIIVLLYAPVIGVNVIASALARGSRRLWLCSGESRTMLYTAAERLAWRSLALLGMPAIGLALIEIRFLPHAGIDMLFALAVCITVAPGALYLGLLSFQRRLNRSLLALTLVAFSALLGGLLAETPQGRALLWIAPLALVALATMLRTLARRRWRGIDWLRFRAAREKSPFALRRI